MITYFHCKSSYECAKNMIKINKINNFDITFDIQHIIDFDKINDNIILFINPGRKGLRDYEIEFIKSSRIKYIIYMACNQTAFLKNLESLNKFKIKDSTMILNMPIINKYQYLYFLYYI